MKRRLDDKLKLEMAMRDVMDNLEDIACASSFYVGEECFEILAIEATEVPDRFRGERSAGCRPIFTQRAEIVRLRVA